MKKTLYLILIFIALTLAYLKFTYGGVATPASIPSPSPTPFTSTAPLTRTFSSDFFTLQYPAEASISALPAKPDSLSWIVQYGQEIINNDQEILNGYRITITRFEVADPESARAQVENEREEIISKCTESEVTSVVVAQVGSSPALSFTNNCLPAHENIYVIMDNSVWRFTNQISAVEEKLLDQIGNQVDSIYNSIILHE